MVDPTSTYIDSAVELEPDVRLLPGTILEGSTVISAGAIVGPDTQLVDTIVGERAVVRQTVARDAEIGDDCTVGPYVSLRPGTRLAAGAHVGTFVETKNAEIGAGAKVPHLSYVGDAEIGPRANIGAGTITANYDGHNKHRTVIGADAADLLEHGAGGAGRGRRGCVHRRRRRGEPGRPGGCARQGRAGDRSMKVGRNVAPSVMRKATDGPGHEEATAALCRLREPGAVPGDRHQPEGAAGRHQVVAVRERRAVLPLRRERSRVRTCSCCRATAIRSTTGSWSS